MKDNTTLEIQEPRTEDRYPDPGSETSRPAVTMSDLEQGQTPLFPETETGRFRSQWRAIQESFVDEPRRSVEQADQLVSNMRNTEEIVNIILDANRNSLMLLDLKVLCLLQRS